jgi:surface carbohydrate biosynthesis protein (TIGR04326 family)
LVLYKDEFYSSGRTISAARPDGMRGWAFQHGTISKDHLVYVNDADWISEERSFRFLPAPDLFLCYGEFTREIVTERGYPKDRVVPLGSLRHDRVYRQPLVSKITREDLGLPTRKPLLTLCAQRRRDSEDWLRLLVGGVQRLGLDCHIVVKPHPRFEFEDAANAIFDELEWTAHTIFYDRLSELLAASDVVLTGSSTTGLDAVLVGTPLITFAVDGEFERFPYAEEGVALKVTDPASMSGALEKVLTPTYRSEWSESTRIEFLRRHLSPNDGHAVDEFVNLLERQVRSSADTSED